GPYLDTPYLDPLEAVTMTDDHGNPLDFVAASGGWPRGAHRAYSVQWMWARPVQSGTYHLTITGGGSQSSTPVFVPEPPTNNWPLDTPAPPASSARFE